MDANADVESGGDTNDFRDESGRVEVPGNRVEVGSTRLPCAMQKQVSEVIGRPLE